MGDILIYALHHEGSLNDSSLGALCEGAKLARALGGEAHAIVLGESVTRELCAELGRYGAAKVYRVEGPEGLAQPVVDAIARVISKRDFRYVLFGGGLLGLEIGAGLAARIDAGVALEVTGVRVDGAQLIAQRPIFGDSAISEIAFASAVGVIVGRLGAFAVEPPAGTAAPVEDLEVGFSSFSLRARMLRHAQQRGDGIDLEGAEILIAGGRGLGSAEGFELCEELARAFGSCSAVAATRAVVDAGWYPYAAQVGQTGKTVSPKLYLAAGISGAIQHKVGMESAENIVAINNDPGAPIFEFSDLGIVGDLNKILPKLSAAVRERKGS
ncbi:MAG: electron transfer flavoprotein subunit alpha/FixB family protein [Solirubrobacteraceae bacterium]|jgi:electron transfer flavoprotein alpha subunit